ncbi:putative carboxyphosphonoenolpyruvate phosphonomutase [Metarhizium anisopliae]
MESTSANRPSAATKLRRMLATKDVIVAPGTGAGACASKLGQADLGFATLNDMRSQAEMIANLDPGTPLIADADTGYGGANMVARTVAQYHRSGVAALHIEDQIQTKRCGHLGGKAVVDTDTFLQRIRAAAQARRRLASDIVVIARTDALQTDGFDEAVRRLKMAVGAGADVAFLEGIQNAQQAREACEALAPVPVLLNMVEHGATPSWTPREARQMGFKIVIFPFAALAPAYKAIRETLIGIKETGRTGLDPEFTPKRLFTVVGLEDAVKIDKEAGGRLYDEA